MPQGQAPREPWLRTRWGALAALGLVLVTASCTAVREDSRRTLDWLDDSLTPESGGARNALLPVAIPLGFLGLAADTLVVNPALAVDDAWGDTVEWLWTSREESGLRRVLFTPLAAGATPFVFAADWLSRSLLPIQPRRTDEERDG